MLAPSELGRGCRDAASAGECVIIFTAFESPAVVSGFDDVAVMGQAIEQRGRHLGVRGAGRRTERMADSRVRRE